MKRVFSNHAQVCHVWAQQTQDRGRGSNIVFRGPRIYSYGDHFEMARFVDSDTVFITADKYSVSTAKHLSLVRRAVLHKTVFEVPTMDNHKENLEYFIDQARETYDKAKRARTNVTWLMGQTQDYVNNARAYMTKFHVEIPDSKRELWLALLQAMRLRVNYCASGEGGAMTQPVKHTPGPWHVGLKPGPMVYGPQGEQIVGLNVMLDSDEVLANAKFIAAAPAMYEALKELVTYLQDHVEDEALDNWAPVLKAAYALAQAEVKP